MTELIRAATWNGQPAVNAVFVHGLGGHAYDTWRRGANDGSFWPVWLAQDIPGLSTWTLAYAAPPTNWLGSAMPLQDRAINVLERLLAEPQLAEGPLVFICHSLGGLVVKQMLREANDQKNRRPEVAALLAQVKAVIFIATPHTGSAHATLLDKLRLLVWPSNSVNDLVKNDANLRSLNIWYRNWSTPEKIKHLIFHETQGTTAGMVVDPSSSDAGLASVTPVPIDANHISICKPLNRGALLYRLTLEFMKKLVKEANPENKVKAADVSMPQMLDLPIILPTYIRPWGPFALRFVVLAFVTIIGFKGVEAMFFLKEPVSRIPTEEIAIPPRGKAPPLSEKHNKDKEAPKTEAAAADEKARQEQDQLEIHDKLIVIGPSSNSETSIGLTIAPNRTGEYLDQLSAQSLANELAHVAPEGVKVYPEIFAQKFVDLGFFDNVMLGSTALLEKSAVFSRVRHVVFGTVRSNCSSNPLVAGIKSCMIVFSYKTYGKGGVLVDSKALSEIGPGSSNEKAALRGIALLVNRQGQKFFEATRY